MRARKWRREVRGMTGLTSVRAARASVRRCIPSISVPTIFKPTGPITFAIKGLFENTKPSFADRLSLSHSSGRVFNLSWADRKN